MKTFNVYDNENQAVRDAYAMLAANIHVSNNQKRLKVFVLTSCNPKEGKTTLAISLSIAMANSGRRVLLIDGDMRKPSEAKRLSDSTEYGLSDYLKGIISIQDVICETNVENFFYLPCGNGGAELNPIGLICSARFDAFLEKARKEYDFVFFDTPALASVADGSLIASKVDAALIVVKMGFTKTTDLERAKEQLMALSPKLLLSVVLNRVKKRDYKRRFGFYNYFYESERFINDKAKKAKEITQKKMELGSQGLGD